MKKFFYYLLVSAFMLQTSISVSSCDGFPGKDDDDIENNGGGNNNGNNNGDNNGDNNGEDNGEDIGGGNTGGENTGSNNVYKDKEDFQNIALELRDEFKASDFENILDLTEYILEEYSEYDAEGVENWLEDCLENLSKELESDDQYDVYETIYRLSAFKGKFTAENGSWKRTSADNLSIHIKDQYGKPCELTLTTSGKTKKIHCFDDEDWYYDYWWDQYGNYYDEEYLESVEKIYIEVPENVTLVLKQNNTELARVVIKADLSSMTGENFNLSKDKYNVNATVYFNGYSFNIENISYQNNKEAKAIANFKHGNKTILSANLTASPSINMEDTGDFEDDFEDAFDSGNVNSTNNVMTVNILNKLKLEGKCADLKKLVEALDDDWNDNTASKVNRHLKINVYFYGSSTATAKVEFEGYDRWCDGCIDYHYELYPVIEFTDYSRYSLEEFFNEEDFKRTINAFESLLKEFENLIGGYDFDF